MFYLDRQYSRVPNCRGGGTRIEYLGKLNGCGGNVCKMGLGGCVGPPYVFVGGGGGNWTIGFYKQVVLIKWNWWKEIQKTENNAPTMRNGRVPNFLSKSFLVLCCI